MKSLIPISKMCLGELSDGTPRRGDEAITPSIGKDANKPAMDSLASSDLMEGDYANDPQRVYGRSMAGWS